ncbi:MAG: PrsW family glutamic-type intramembrane protease [Treponema sp.]|nr:PrsW family glutamic-type intramembrane protease [Treponema sp.]
MNVYAPIILCFVPFVTMFALFTILVPKISVVKELIASLAGLLALIPITLAQFLIPGMRLFGQSSAGGILLYSIVFLGLVEECFKALLLFIVGAKEEKLSCWFCYSLLAGMIFGCFESVIYFFLNIQTIGHGVTLNLIYLRMFTAVLVHTLCAGLGGFTVYYFKNIRRNVWPLLNAVLIHGLYDYFVSFDTYVKFFCIIVILSAAIKCRVCFLQIAEEERNKKSAKRTAIDPNKTIEMPKNPAIIIPVKNTVPEDTLVSETDVIDEDAEDFDQIEREAKSELKAAKKPAAKKAPAKKSAEKKAAPKTKSAASKTKSAAKTEGKTAKRAAPSASKKASSKPASKTKATAKPKTGAAKSAGKPKSASAKKTSSKPKTGAAKKSAPKTKGKK